jgi:hypothetical protein
VSVGVTFGLDDFNLTATSKSVLSGAMIDLTNLQDSEKEEIAKFASDVKKSFEKNRVF